MNIVVLSGKGGTGKTTISTNLALLMGANYMDCDVEEPNGFIFLEPEQIKSRDVKVEFPDINMDKCTLCGKCVSACKFNALAQTKEKLIVFEQLCHSCGVCQLVCPEGAISYNKRTSGKVEEGKKNGQLLRRGLLNIGEPIAIPVIKEVLSDLPEGEINILDSPPGTSCNVVTSLHYANRAILVTEPTAFGLHDLKMAVELVRIFKIPFGLIINKYDKENDYLNDYIKKEEIKLLGHIPYERGIAETYSRGDILINNKEYREAFLNIEKVIREELI